MAKIFSPSNFAEADRLADQMLEDPLMIDRYESEAREYLNLIEKFGDPCKAGLDRGFAAVAGICAMARRLASERSSTRMNPA